MYTQKWGQIYFCPHSGGEMSNPGRSGYVGGPENWREFLACWDREILDSLKLEGAVSSMERQVLARGSQSKGPVSEAAISEAEKRLGTELPKSLKDFWRASNGLMHLRLDADDGLIVGAETVSWLKSSKPDLIPENIGAPISDEDYFDYGPDQDPVYLRDAYIQSMLVVSDLVDSGIYLLNPEVKTQDGEWEAWFLGWELPGALRFKSFAHLMRYSYYKATQDPEFDGIYPEDQLQGTCADRGLTESS